MDKSYKKFTKDSVNNRVFTQISLSDIQSLKEYDGSEQSKLKCLYALGVDTNVPEVIEYIHCEHRSKFTNKVSVGELIIGYERIDKEWMQSGYASLDDQVATRGDYSLRGELNYLLQRGSNMFDSQIEGGA